MSNVIQFKPRRDCEVSSRDRVEAMVKGKIETYECNNCGELFDVLFGNRPDKCPNCNLRIDWGNSEC